MQQRGQLTTLNSSSPQKQCLSTVAAAKGVLARLIFRPFFTCALSSSFSLPSFSSPSLAVFF